MSAQGTLDVEALTKWMDDEGLPGKGEPIDRRFIFLMESSGIAPSAVPGPFGVSSGSGMSAPLTAGRR